MKKCSKLKEVYDIIENDYNVILRKLAQQKVIKDDVVIDIYEFILDSIDRIGEIIDEENEA